MRNPPDRACPRYLLLAAALAGIAFGLLIIFDIAFVRIEKDEGLYAYAFRLIAEGKVPYRDFSYIESPALPYYYVAILAGPGITLQSVRIVCALTGGLALLILLGCARRTGGSAAAAVAAILLFANPALAEWFSRDVTYPLVSLLLALAIRLEISGRSAATRVAGQGVLLALAGAVKASLGVVALVWMGLLLWLRRRERRALLIGAAAFTATLAAAVLPFFLLAPEAFRFNVIEAAASRGRLFPFMNRPDPLDQWLEFGWGQKILATRQVLLWNFPLVVLTILTLFRTGRGSSPVGSGFRDAGRPILLALGTGVLFHLLVPTPAYPNYLFMFLPALVLPVAVRYAAMGMEPEGHFHQRWILGLPVLLGALTFLAGGDPHQVGLQVGSWRHGPDRELARLVARVVPPHGLLLTDYLPVAVESNRRVVPGSEGGRTSLLPDFPEDRAAALHVLNRNRFLSILRRGEAHGVVLTGQLFEDSFRSVPGFLEEADAELASRYDLVREFPPSVYFPYGRIRVFRVRQAPADEVSVGEDFEAGRGGGENLPDEGGPGVARRAQRRDEGTGPLGR